MATLKPTRSFSARKVRNLLRHSVGDIADAERKDNMVWRRFDAAYDAAHNCAMVVLEVNRLEIEGKGHHKEALEYFMKTLNLSGSLPDKIPQMVRVRNSSRYDGEDVAEESDVQEAIRWAMRIMTETEQYLQKHHPQLLKPDAG